MKSPIKSTYGSKRSANAKLTLINLATWPVLLPSMFSLFPKLLSTGFLGPDSIKNIAYLKAFSLYFVT